jgi:hypothetical protein
MAIYGSIGEFTIDDGDINEYFERFDCFLDANKIVEATQQRSVFLATVGATTYRQLRSLCNNDPKGKTFEELKKILKEHLSPRPNTISQRLKFYMRSRASSESISQYLAELRKCAEYCDFDDKLDEQLRDRLVCGCGNDRIQEKLLTIKDLTLKKAIEAAVAMETAYQDAREIRHSQGSDTARDVNLNQLSGRKEKECYRCGSKTHMADGCPFKTKDCFRCGKVGHISRTCRSEKKGRTGGDGKAKVFQVANCGDSEESVEDMADIGRLDSWSLYPLTGGRSGRDPIVVSVVMNGKDVPMELDTGAAVSVMSSSCYNRVSSRVLKASQLRLKTYTGEVVKPLRVGKVNVRYGGQSNELPITVVEGNVPTLMGRDWLGKLKLEWSELFPAMAEVHAVHKAGENRQARDLVGRFPEVFTEELGCLKDFKVSIPVSSEAKPRFFKARPVPYALRARVEAELDKLEGQGVWSRVSYSRWAAPIVPVLKDARDPCSAVRICGDYKSTVNQVAPLDTYPIPNVADQLAALAGGDKFTKLDLSQAYQQLELDDPTKELLTISTHKGLYQPSRLQFGVHSATGIFQRVMDGKLAGIPFVQVRVDDILVSGRNDQEHLGNLEAVLQALKTAGLTLKPAKCSFMQPQVVYCGHIISKEGVKPVESNVDAVLKAPIPTNVSELKSFLGMANYYHNFLPGLATMSEPLHQLLRKEVKWNWTTSCDAAFKKLKSMLYEAPVLAHFDITRPMVVHCDASPYGVGGVFSQISADGTERPVSYCSRTLTSAERNYAHIEKEGLALVFSVKKFHQYLYGNKFLLKTDHKPLLGLFSEEKGLPTRAAARILRWALLLSAYNYKLEYREGAQNANADALSRLPLDMKAEDVRADIAGIHLTMLAEVPVTETEVRAATRNDPTLSKVLCSILEGWKLDCKKNKELAGYETRRSELSTEGGCLLWGSRVVIPSSLQEKVLQMLHDVHPGMVRMKSLARSHVWWPGIDADIEAAVRTCRSCQENQSNPAIAPVHSWEYPTAPWERLHVDFAGPMDGKFFLIVIDAYSKWLEVETVPSPSSGSVISKLQKLFATHGLPLVIVSDNGSAFISEEFKAFLKSNGVRLIHSAPYHPASNGQAERAVRVFKNSLKKLEGGDLQEKMNRLLFHHRTTPHTTTGKCPAELLLGRRVRTHLDIMRPNMRRKVEIPQLQKKMSGQTRFFEAGDLVLVKNFRGRPKWITGTVTEKLGSADYVVEVTDGGQVHRHVDQIVRRSEEASWRDTDGVSPEYSATEVITPGEQVEEAVQIQEEDDEEPIGRGAPETIVSSDVPTQQPQVRRSTRSRRLPVCFQEDL